jgi:hypothetical protein
LPLLSGFSCKVYLQHLSKILLYEACFLLPPSSRHLGILSPSGFCLFCFVDFVETESHYVLQAGLKFPL